MKFIEFNGKHKGKFFAVSDEQYDEFSQYTWYLDAHGYPTTTIKAHQLALKKYKRDGKTIIDHKNRSALDNTLDNLRVVSHCQNMQNRKIGSNNKSGYKGVVYRPKNSINPYVAFIGKGKGGRNRHLGCFSNPVDAARAYDLEAKKIYGEFAVLNFPEEQ